ncbi:MAG: hypothetical protein COV99_07675 [Bacteroidetes bacterium CG12_big_fil_rev_8_21_14_0_65_60_17]|nr:MAG: hypothetical protein COV99_07675 [Bacteroidetes bacterium CG12_big_fil_rev_8_21_14_0_65_60_17]
MTWNTLRTALRSNAAFSALCGVISLVQAEALSAWMGGFDPWILRALGPGLLLFAAILYMETRRSRPVPASALAISLADLVWVIGSVIVLIAAPDALSSGGTWTVLLVALVVLVFATWQLVGLRGLTRNTRRRTAARSGFEVHQEVAASPEAIWGVIRQLDRIGEFYSALKSVKVSRNGARRTCENHKGQRWSEDVAALSDDNRELSLRFDTDAPGFPFPMRPMYGGWTVRRVGGKTSVTVWYEFTMKWGLLGELLAPLVAEQTRKTMAKTIRQMERAAAA